MNTKTVQDTLLIRLLIEERLTHMCEKYNFEI
jgi:hypothetical protein